MKPFLFLSIAFLVHFSEASACQKWTPALFFLTEKGCDTLLLTDGRRIAAEIERVTADEIFYTDCDDPDLRVFVISRKKVAEVRRYQKPPMPQQVVPTDKPVTYTEGEEPEPKPTLQQKKKPVVDEKKAAERQAWSYMVMGVAVFALLFSLLGAPFSLIIAFSMISRFKRLWRRLGKHPKKRRLRVFLVIGLSFSILTVIGFFILLYAILTISFPDLSWLSPGGLGDFHW